MVSPLHMHGIPLDLSSSSLAQVFFFIGQSNNLLGEEKKSPTKNWNRTAVWLTFPQVRFKYIFKKITIVYVIIFFT